jgi:hypothetical protein
MTTRVGHGHELLDFLDVAAAHAVPVIADVTGTRFCDTSAASALLRARLRAEALSCPFYTAIDPAGLVRQVIDRSPARHLIKVSDGLSPAITIAITTAPPPGEAPRGVAVHRRVEDRSAGSARWFRLTSHPRGCRGLGARLLRSRNQDTSHGAGPLPPEPEGRAFTDAMPGVAWLNFWTACAITALLPSLQHSRSTMAHFSLAFRLSVLLRFGTLCW